MDALVECCCWTAFNDSTMTNGSITFEHGLRPPHPAVPWYGCYLLQEFRNEPFLLDMTPPIIGQKKISERHILSSNWQHQVSTTKITTDSAHPPRFQWKKRARNNHWYLQTFSGRFDSTHSVSCHVMSCHIISCHVMDFCVVVFQHTTETLHSVILSTSHETIGFEPGVQPPPKAFAQQLTSWRKWNVPSCSMCDLHHIHVSYNHINSLMDAVKVEKKHCATINQDGALGRHFVVHCISPSFSRVLVSQHCFCSIPRFHPQRMTFSASKTSSLTKTNVTTDYM